MRIWAPVYEYEIKVTHTSYESVYVVHVYLPNHASVYVFCAVSVPSSVYVFCKWVSVSAFTYVSVSVSNNVSLFMNLLCYLGMFQLPHPYMKPEYTLRTPWVYSCILFVSHVSVSVSISINVFCIHFRFRISSRKSATSFVFVFVSVFW